MENREKMLKSHRMLAERIYELREESKFCSVSSLKLFVQFLYSKSRGDMSGHVYTPPYLYSFA